MSLRETAHKFLVASEAMDMLINGVDGLLSSDDKSELASQILSEEDEVAEEVADKALKICLDRLTASAKIVTACYKKHKGGQQ